MPNTKRQHYIHIHLSNLYDFIGKGLSSCQIISFQFLQVFWKLLIRGNETKSIKLYWEQKKRLKECFTCIKSDYFIILYEQYKLEYKIKLTKVTIE